MKLWYSSLPTISEAINGHRNSLGLIRLVLALAVIIDHAFPLGGFGEDPVKSMTKGQATLGDLAVIGFFAISGYLITKSGLTSDFLQFMWRRFLRIFPAFWLVLFISGFLVGPVFWNLSGGNLGSYFTLDSNGPLGYIAKNWTLNIGAYGIYDIFQSTTPWGLITGASVFNGSLWTLIYEWTCYLLIGILVITQLLKRFPYIVLAIAAALAVLAFIFTIRPEVISGTFLYIGDVYFVRLTYAFFIGASLAVLSRVVKAHWVFGFLALFVLLLTLRTNFFYVVGVIAFTYLLLWLSAWLPRSWQWIGAKNDYSYGIYIYGFLVQQMLAFWKINEYGYLPYVIATIPVTVVLAWLSWHSVEKRAMSLKSWGPGKGISFWFERIKKLMDKSKDLGKQN